MRREREKAESRNNEKGQFTEDRKTLHRKTGQREREREK